MREVDGRLYVEKQEVARRLLHSAIRNIFNGECPIATHVLIGSATTLMHEYAKANGKDLALDVEKYVHAEFKKGFAQAMKSHYNFFKHANHDADLAIDITNISEVNEVAVYGAIIEYWNIFPDRPHQMQLFFSIATIMYPDLFNWDTLGAEFPEVERHRLELASRSRGELCSLARDALAQGLTQVERTSETAPIFKTDSAHYDGPPHRDMFKRRL
ncbi:hypothetical protein CHY08_15125 [Rhizobium leguminosarum bv. viciae]|uniref:hypothetical protein n=1 Tax=Rhizobium leguminosarum TaxID=384 RepID=UPI000B8CF92B|nr:hypothetical protein [Rhizobium leguminosarum]ASR08318.1 hypothetical protein CHY08_15125 [Rhizobium leguminosarum bv. viciae]